MKAFAFYTALALAITAVIAGPIPTPAEIFERAYPGKCGNHQYSSAQTQNAWGDALNILQSKRPLIVDNGNTEWPHVFRNDDTPSVPMPAQCRSGYIIELHEYPIFRDNSNMRNGKDPGLDRVVLGLLQQGSTHTYVQCRLMTHDGAPWNRFVPCD